MASRLIVSAAVLVVACQAGPVWFADNRVDPRPVLFIREGRAPDFATPSFAYGLGSGFSYDFGGIKHSSAFGTSIQSGEGQAYGSGYGGSDGKAFASGIGYANANPSPQPIYRTSYPYNYSPYNGLRRDYGNNFASSSVNSNQQNFGNYGNQYRPYSSSATAVQNGSDQGGIRNSFSSAQSNNGFGSNTAVAASHSANGYSANTAQTTQQVGSQVRQAGASIFEGPGIQAAHSHVVNTGNF